MQQPVAELRTLGKEVLNVASQAIPAGTAAYEVPFKDKSYDLSVSLALNVLQSANERITLSYDVARQMLTLDRTHSGNAGFHPMFARSLETARVPLRDEQLQLPLLADKSVVDVSV